MVLSAASAVLHQPAQEREEAAAALRGKRPPKPIREMSREEYESWLQSQQVA